jgi:predicted N-acetyltransferase YhbS
VLQLGDKAVLFTDTGQHDDHVEALYSAAFGPGRFAKAATRLRERNVCVRAFSVLASLGGQIVGACRLWPILGENGQRALFLGPIAVDMALRNEGLGRALVEACLERVIQADTNQAIVLVGDLAFFAPSGFVIVPDGHVIMPGPLDTRRLLWRVAGIDAAHLPYGQL